MARGINKVILIGNLGRDPESKQTQGGATITKLAIATSEQWNDKQSGNQQERTEWHSVVCFARLAEIAAEYLRKGSKVYIEGSLRTSSWEKDGVKQYRTDIIARELQMLDSRGDGQQHSQQQQDDAMAQLHGQQRQTREQSPGQQRTSAQPQPAPALTDEDLPF